MSATLVSAQSLITDALEEIGAFGVGQTLSATYADRGLRRLNAMMSAWKIQSLTVPVMVREVFDTVANQTSYTIGPGANFNTIRPESILAAAVLLTASSPPVEVPVGIMTDQAYASLAIKGQTSSQWTAIWYQPTFVTSGWGKIYLWPIPTVSTNDLVLYFLQPLTEFADLTTQYQIPDGYYEAILYNLALRLCNPFGTPVPQDLPELARAAMKNIKRQNVKQSDMRNEFAMIGTQRFGYNIQTDQSQG